MPSVQAGRSGTEVHKTDRTELTDSTVTVLREQSHMLDQALGGIGPVNLTFREFICVLPDHVTARHSKSQLREWYRTADIDGDGFITLYEFFIWALSVASSTVWTSASCETMCSRLLSDGEAALRLTLGCLPGTL